jgi:hypothetical protein
LQSAGLIRSTDLALESVPDEDALGQVHGEQQRGVADEEDRAELDEEQRRPAGAGAGTSRGGAAVRRLRTPQVASGHHRALHVVRPAVIRRGHVHAPLRPRESPGREAASAAGGDPVLLPARRSPGPAIFAGVQRAARRAGVERVVDAEAAEDC